MVEWILLQVWGAEENTETFTGLRFLTTVTQHQDLCCPTTGVRAALTSSLCLKSSKIHASVPQTSCNLLVPGFVDDPPVGSI